MALYFLLISEISMLTKMGKQVQSNMSRLMRHFLYILRATCEGPSDIVGERSISQTTD